MVAPPCDRCRGARIYFDSKIEVGRYGSLKLCSCLDEDYRNQWCPCRTVRKKVGEISRMFKQAEIPERFRWKFQEDFKTAAPDGAPVQFAQNVQSYVSTLVDSEEEPRRGFLLYGPPGTGKTMLGCIMLNELILHRYKPGRFVNLSRSYFQRLRDTFSESSQEYGQSWKIMDELCSLPFLMLDDFGVQRDTPWEQEMLYDLVDSRYGAERFTIVTTNQGLDEIQQLNDGRIYSRLVEMCHLVEMEGVDYRLHLQIQR